MRTRIANVDFLKHAIMQMVVDQVMTLIIEYR